MAPSRRGASVLGRSIQHVLVDLDDTLYDVPEIANAVRAAITGQQQQQQLPLVLQQPACSPRATTC